MAKKSLFSENLEYFALRFACATVNAIPYRAAMALADVLAFISFDLLRFKRKRTLGRIAGVFPEIGMRQMRSIARSSLANVLKTSIEMMRASRLDRKWMDAHVQDGLLYKERLQSFVDEGKGVVVMVPHSGNWYMAAWSMAKYGLPLCAIAARQRNAKIDAWMKRQYGDIEVVERGSAKTLAAIISRIENGRVFAILPDLRSKTPDVEVPFLGGKANVSHAGALFAVKCGSPIVVAAMRRENGKHVFKHVATLRPDPAAPDAREEARRLTAEAMHLIDGCIREKPGDWFWYNKRWILDPPRKRHNPSPADGTAAQ